jgi:hypothetical protein
MPTRNGGSASQSLQSDIGKDEATKAFRSLPAEKVMDFLATESASLRYSEKIKNANRDGYFDPREESYVRAKALEDFVKERNLDKSLSYTTQGLLKQLDKNVGEGKYNGLEGAALKAMDNIQLDTRHFVDKSLTVLTANKEEDTVESLNRYYLGERFAVIQTSRGGMKAVFMGKSDGESKFKAGDFIGNSPANKGSEVWNGLVQKVVTYTPQVGKQYLGKVEWLRDDYPVTRD